jgi:hypothetical protein
MISLPIFLAPSNAIAITRRPTPLKINKSIKVVKPVSRVQIRGLFPN